MHRQFRTPRRQRLLLLLSSCWLWACEGTGGDAITTPVPPVAFAAVDTRAQTAFANDAPVAIEGMGLAIYGRDGAALFENMYGDFAPDRRVAVASASKLVTSLVLLRLVEQGFLSLQDTTGTVLGWTGPQAQITLEQLLSFTSGLPPSFGCIDSADLTLNACVQQISTLAPIAPPGEQFDYGSTHLHVAAGMAEVITGSPWNEVFRLQLGQPLGLAEAVRYYSFPRQRIGLDNPRAAGGLVASMDEYATILGLVLNDGRHNDTPLLSPALVDRIFVAPFADVVMGQMPDLAINLEFGYGLGAWLECDRPVEGCDVISSPGLFGFTPWVDRANDYMAILGMEAGGIAAGATEFSLTLAQDLQPLIIAELAD